MSLLLLRFNSKRHKLCFAANLGCFAGVLLSVSSCLPGPGFFEKSKAGSIVGGAGMAIEAAMEGEKAVAMVSAMSSVTQTITAPESSSMAGVSLAISPGTLQFDMAIGLEESAGLISTAAANEMGMSFDGEAGMAINLSNDSGVTELPPSAPPMQLKIPIFGGSLRLAGDESSLVVFFRQAKGEDSCSERVYPPSTFALEGSSIAIGVRRFGAYQPLWVPTADLENKAKAATDADGSFVIERPGCRVETMAEVKKLPKVTISELFIEREEKIFIFSAEIDGDEVKSCKVYAKNITNDEKYVQEDSGPNILLDLSKVNGPINGRAAMSCELVSGRTVETAFKAFRSFDFLVKMESGYKEKLRMRSDVDASKVENCRIEAKSEDKYGKIEQHQEPVGDANAIKIEGVLIGSENDFDFKAQVRLVCEQKGGGQLVSNFIRFFGKDAYTENQAPQEPPLPPFMLSHNLGVFALHTTEGADGPYVNFEFGVLKDSLERLFGPLPRTSAVPVEFDVCKEGENGTCVTGVSCSLYINFGHDYICHTLQNDWTLGTGQFYVSQIRLSAPSEFGNIPEKRLNFDANSGNFMSGGNPVAGGVWFGIEKDSMLHELDFNFDILQPENTQFRFKINFFIGSENETNNSYREIDEICAEFSYTMLSGGPATEYRCHQIDESSWSSNSPPYASFIFPDRIDSQVMPTWNHIMVRFRDNLYAPIVRIKQAEAAN